MSDTADKDRSLASAALGTGGGGAWYRQWFNADYLSLYQNRDTAEAEEQAEFVAKSAPSADFNRVLDVGCGAGRHIAALARHGFTVNGVDLSAELLQVARGSLAWAEKSRLCRCDMRALPFSSGVFDIVVSLFTSFGYFDTDAEHQQVLNEWRRIVRPGGKVLLDYLNPVSAVPGLVPSEERTTETGSVLIRRSYNQVTKRIEKEIHIRPRQDNSGVGSAGPDKIYRESVRLFTTEEIISLLTRAGFSTVSTFGDFKGNNLSAVSPRLILFGE